MMKKIIILLAGIIIVAAADAQVQRKRAVLPVTDSTKTDAAVTKNDRQRKKEMFKELNLSKEQRVKLKGVKQDGKAKIDAIQNDATLSDAEKKEKMKELKKQQLTSTMALLNDEQKAKLKQMLKEKKGQEGEDVMMDEN
jgi:hypothetical protein